MQARSKAATSTLVLLAALTASAQTRRPMTFEDMMKMRRLGDTALSPDGKWVLFAATDVDLEQRERMLAAH